MRFAALSIGVTQLDELKQGGVTPSTPCLQCGEPSVGGARMRDAPLPGSQPMAAALCEDHINSMPNTVYFVRWAP